MSSQIEVTQTDVNDLLKTFLSTSFTTAAYVEGTVEYSISKRCERLFKLDYNIFEFDNANGPFCAHYPGNILIPESEKNHTAQTLTATTEASAPLNLSNGSVPGNDDETPNSEPIEGAGAAANEEASSTIGEAAAVGDTIQSFVTFAGPLLEATTTTATSTTTTTTTTTTTATTTNQNVTNNAQSSEAHLSPPQQQQPAPAPSSPPPPSPTQPQAQVQAQVQAQAQVLAQAQAQALSPSQQRSHQQLQHQQQNTIYEDPFELGKMRELIGTAKYARCRQRFVVPVILYKGKYVCRSATLSVWSEVIGRVVVDYLSGIRYAIQNEPETNPTDSNDVQPSEPPPPFSYHVVLKSDAQLLTALKVSTIVDLMVERRKIKYFMPVSSSEKADNILIYKDFNLLALPYPGCEFFKKFRRNDFTAEGIFYNWNGAFNDAPINIPKSGPPADMAVNWTEYRKWDIVELTQNYLKLTLKYVQEDKSGVLIHCISGWDRTPLFISLVRLSMWADGLIHQSLNALQITYFTIAYDWFLFGHQLSERLGREEAILYFCFHFLKYISGDEYSIVEQPRRRTKTTSSSGGSSIIVVKSDNCDEEPIKEEYTLNFDQENIDSNSISSNCDSISITDNFYSNTTAPNANPLMNRSPNQKSRMRTSPISVPGRQRHESTSSTGSWQVVTETGSLESSTNGSFKSHHAGSKSESANIPASNAGGGTCANTSSSSSSSSNSDTNSSSGSCTSSSSASNTTSTSDGNSSSTSASHGSSNASRSRETGGGNVNAPAPSAAPPSSLRLERLKAVRASFASAYALMGGMGFNNGNSTLGNLLGNFL